MSGHDSESSRRTASLLFSDPSGILLSSDIFPGKISFYLSGPRLYCVLISPTISSRDRVAIYSYPSAISSGEILIPVLIHSTTTNVIAFA